MSGLKSIIYDFDGVILDTVSVKIDAFCSVYAHEQPEKVRAVRRYAEAHGGRSRYEKFAHFEAEIFCRPVSERGMECLCAAYEAVVSEGVARAAFIAGALEAVSILGGRLDQHVVSAAPEGELNRTLSDRGIRHHFKTTAGAPGTKLSAFRRILAEDRVDAGSVLAIGDSLTEYHAAVELRIPFLAIVAPGAIDRFPKAVPRQPDLSGLVGLVEGRTG